MGIDRRGFIRSAGAVLAWIAGRPALASAGERAAGIHRDTRNTRLRALRRRLGAQSTPGRSKPYPNAARRELPPPRVGSGPPLAEVVARAAPARAFDGSPMGADELGRLLHLTNGVTGAFRTGDDSIPLRAAPSAGALYAGEVYVVAERVGDLPAGIYYFDVERHALVLLREGSALDEIAGAVEHPQALARAPAVLLLTNVFGRYTGRYGDRGYRYALIDTGHIGENARLAAAAAGLSERAFLRFHDDSLDGLLGIDGRSEAVCAIHALGRAGPAGEEGPGARLVEKGESRSGSAPERYHAATRLVPGDGESPRAVATIPGSARGPIQNAPPTTVDAAIRARRSAMNLRAEPIGRPALAFILDAAAGHPTLSRAPEVGIRVIVNRVGGIPPGLYRHDPRTGRLRRERGGDLSKATVAACMDQDKAGAAAVVCAMVGRIAEAVERSGERSYRELLVEAGAIGQRLYLAAEAAGLAARNLAAFWDADLNALLGVDGDREAVLHVTVFGPGR